MISCSYLIYDILFYKEDEEKYYTVILFLFPPPFYLHRSMFIIFLLYAQDPLLQEVEMNGKLLK